jgi:DNA mismatch repair protein MutS2
LARIRRDLGIAHSRLLDRLNRFVTSGQYRQYLQESLVTQRAGRYVIPLKAEFKGRIQGVIHDQSASGATFFIEPLATVELNNKWRQLQLDEEDEIRKILMQPWPTLTWRLPKPSMPRPSKQPSPFWLVLTGLSLL